MNAIFLGFIWYAAFRHFGALDAAAIVAAVFLVMPWGPGHTARTFVKEMTAAAKKRFDQ